MSLWGPTYNVYLLYYIRLNITKLKKKSKLKLEVSKIKQ